MDHSRGFGQVGKLRGMSGCLNLENSTPRPLSTIPLIEVMTIEEEIEGMDDNDEVEIQQSENNEIIEENVDEELVEELIEHLLIEDEEDDIDFFNLKKEKVI